jgi:5-(carboxyamino)imidazole ribonucleotide synthase
MFLTDEGTILVNEIAPRVHNSGHYTIEACATSQFEQHIRAITGMPLGPTGLIVPAAVMINILGERNGPTEVTGLEAASDIESTFVHLYGKSPTKIDRKMGHITATGSTLEEARARAQQAREQIGI